MDGLPPISRLDLTKKNGNRHGNWPNLKISHSHDSYETFFIYRWWLTYYIQCIYIYIHIIYVYIYIYIYILYIYIYIYVYIYIYIMCIYIYVFQWWFSITKCKKSHGKAAFGTNALTFMGHLGDAPGVAHRVRVMVQNASYTSVITPFIECIIP